MFFRMFFRFFASVPALKCHRRSRARKINLLIYWMIEAYYYNGVCKSNHQYLEKVQTKIPVYISTPYRPQFCFYHYSTSDTSASFNYRRDRADLFFLHKLFHGVIFCRDLLSYRMFWFPRSVCSSAIHSTRAQLVVVTCLHTDCGASTIYMERN